MRSINLTAATMATMATLASARITTVEEIHIIETLGFHTLPGVVEAAEQFTPKPNDPRKLFARQQVEISRSCIRRLNEITETEPQPPREVRSYILDTMDVTTSQCTFTAPSSISDDLISYISTAVQWVVDSEPSYSSVLDDCVDNWESIASDLINEPLPSGCPTPATILFTGSSNTTETVELETVLAEITNGIDSGASTAKAGSVGAVAAAAFAGVLGVFAML